MVTKAAPAPTRKTTAIVPWDEEMARFAKKQSSVEKPMGLFKQVAVNGGQMIIDEKPVPGNKLRCIVLASAHENQWYDKPYNAAVPSVPVCYAFGDEDLEDPEAEMEPPVDVEDRQGFPDGEDQGGEGAKCANCWANRMGTADQGRGKACKNIRRMILTTEDALDSPQAMKDAEARMFKVPVMSVRNWVNFVHDCDDLYKRPSWGVVVLLSVVPDPKSQWQIKFDFQELIQFDAALYAATKKRAEQSAKDLLTPYPKLEAPPPPPPRGRGGAAKKATAAASAAAPTGPATRKASKY